VRTEGEVFLDTFGGLFGVALGLIVLPWGMDVQIIKMCRCLAGPAEVSLGTYTLC